MSGFAMFKFMKSACRVLVVAAALYVPLLGQAHAADVVTTYKDENGWKLLVNGNPFYIKGVVWGYTPRNENYTYNLWGEGDDFVRKVLDYEMGLMKAAGVNSIRSFAMIPPKWITYIYEEHGIMTVVNPLMGRYGYTVGGKWVPFTDYSDELTRAVLKADMLEIVETYKDVPGVLMFAFGNESNYGLSWSSFEIENLPEGEQQREKAKYLYSLFNEVMAAGKEIAPNHPFTIVNGDIQYIDLIAEYCTDMDLLGSNVYRGKSFTNLWEEVDKKLDMPVVFFEFGSDAFNARTFQEDQKAQAEMLKYQWQEMYNKSYGNGEEGNAIGGYVFEWRDEWWKYLQVENLDKQDTNASWSNQAYPFDWQEGKNNMNEEWFGITALGKPNSDGVYEARPRMAYDVLAEIWSMDPYGDKKVALNQGIDTMNMDYLEVKSDVRMLKQAESERKEIVHFTGGELRVEMLLKGTEQGTDEQGDFGDQFSNGEMIFLDFGFQPTDDVEGQMSVNILGNVADTEPLELQYGRRGRPVIVEGSVPVAGVIEAEDVEIVLNDRERVEIYDFSATYTHEYFDMEAFYHTPRYHWKYEGDFFGLIRETTDLDGQDIWNAKAPRGVEFAGKGMFDGIKLVVGPEVYWGSNPKAVLKYDGNIFNTDFTFIHAEDLDRANSSASATAETEVETRQTTLYTKKVLGDGLSLEIGGIMASTEKVDDRFQKEGDGGAILADEIDFEDTLGMRTKLNFPLFGAQAYVSAARAGLVADGGAQLREFGTRLPYAEFGNKEEYEAGVMMNFGNWMVFPRVLYRDNLEDAVPNRDASSGGGFLTPGLTPRNRDDDPFAVLDNRKVRSAEVFVTFDPTGATPFYAWDNDMREDAKFAFNVGATYNAFRDFTDSYQFFFEPENRNAAFGAGLPPEDTWELSSRLVYNPTQKLKLISTLVGGNLQSTGNPDGGARSFFEAYAKAVYNRRHILDAYAKFDAFGPYDFHRQFNVTFPYQYRLDYSWLLDERRDERYSTKIGIRGLLRGVDDDSPTNEFNEGENDYLWQVVSYFKWAF